MMKAILLASAVMGSTILAANAVTYVVPVTVETRNPSLRLAGWDNGGGQGCHELAEKACTSYAVNSAPWAKCVKDYMKYQC